MSDPTSRAPRLLPAPKPRLGCCTSRAPAGNARSMTSTVWSVDALSTTTTWASASCDTDCKVAAIVDDELCVTMTAATLDTPDGPGIRALSTGDRARGSRRTRRRRLRRQHVVAARTADDPLARAVRTARRPA